MDKLFEVVIQVIRLSKKAIPIFPARNIRFLQAMESKLIRPDASKFYRHSWWLKCSFNTKPSRHFFRSKGDPFGLQIVAIGSADAIIFGMGIDDMRIIG